MLARILDSFSSRFALIKRQNWTKKKQKQVVCSMLRAFLHKVMRVTLLWNGCGLAPKLLLHNPRTKYIRKQKCHKQ